MNLYFQLYVCKIFIQFNFPPQRLIKSTTFPSAAKDKSPHYKIVAHTTILYKRVKKAS